MELTFSRLRLYNVLIGLFQLLTGCAILGISDYDFTGKLPWYTMFVGSWSRDNGKAGEFYVPAPKKVVNFPIGIWSGSFLILSALDHLLVSLPKVNALYNRLLCKNCNPFRWIEYSVSASIMSVMIAQLCGVTDIHLLFTIAVLMGTCMLFGWQMEVLNGERLPCFEYAEGATKSSPAPLDPHALERGPYDATAFISSAYGAPTAAEYTANGGSGVGQRVDWGPFTMGCIPFLAAKLVTACYFFQAVAKGDPPGFVWALFFILTGLYSLFAVNQVLQFKQVRGFRGFGKAEFWYMILSLTSKQLLAWITYGGTKRFQSEVN